MARLFLREGEIDVFNHKKDIFGRSLKKTKRLIQKTERCPIKY